MELDKGICESMDSLESQRAEVRSEMNEASLRIKEIMDFDPKKWKISQDDCTRIESELSDSALSTICETMNGVISDMKYELDSSGSRMIDSSESQVENTSSSTESNLPESLDADSTLVKRLHRLVV